MSHPGVPVAIGAGLLAAGMLLLITDGASDDAAADTEEATTSVVVAVDDLEPGQRGADVLAANRVTVEEWRADPPVGSLRSRQQLAGVVLTDRVLAGQPLLMSDTRPETAREAGSVVVPRGSEALSLTVPFTAGGAGYVGAGDLVNLYAVLERAGDAHLVLLDTDVPVLDVSHEVAPYAAAGPRPESSSLTFLLALDADTAESILLFGTSSSFHLTLADVAAPDRPRLVQTLTERFERFRSVTPVPETDVEE